MLTPHTVDQLVDAITIVDGENVEESVRQDLWAHSFLQIAQMKDPDRREIFCFLVYCSFLLRIPIEQQQNIKNILTEMGLRFFADNEFWQPSIKFTDIHNVVDDIFRLFEKGMTKKQDIMTLRAKMVMLSEDESVQSGLDPVFGDFIKRPNLHPTSVLQQCILSLL